MASVREELEQFHRFVIERLNHGADDSFDDLLLEWHEKRENESVHQAIRRGLAEIDAGHHQPLEQAMAEIRAELGLPHP